MIRALLAVAATLIFALGYAAWATRYEHLPPTGVQHRLGKVDSVVLCRADRWGSETTCHLEPVIDRAEIARAIRETNDRALGPYVPYYSPLHPSNAGKK